MVEVELENEEKSVNYLLNNWTGALLQEAVARSCSLLPTWQTIMNVHKICWLQTLRRKIVLSRA